MANLVSELLIGIGYQVDSKKLKGAETAGVGAATRVEGAWKKSAKQIGVSVLAIGAVITGAVAGVVKLTASIAESGDTFAKEGKKIGITASALQELSFAADRAGADSNKLVKAIAKMGKNITDARLKGIGPFVDQMDALGISIEEFDGLSPEEIFSKLADTVQGIEDPITRSAFAMDVFGKSGRDLIPLLAEGSEGIANMRGEAQRLGFSMSDEVAAGSEVFVDSMTDLKGVLGGLKFQIGGALIPVIGEQVEALKEWIVQNKDLIASKAPEFVAKFAAGLKKAIVVGSAIASNVASFIKLMFEFRTVIQLVIGVLVGFKLAALAAVAPFAAIGLAAFAAGAAIGTAMANADKAIQSTRKRTRELLEELKKVRAERKALEKRETEADERSKAIIERKRKRVLGFAPELLEESGIRGEFRRSRKAQEIEDTIKRETTKAANKAGADAEKAARRQGLSAEQARKRGGLAAEASRRRAETSVRKARAAASQAFLAGGGQKEIQKAVAGALPVKGGGPRAPAGGGGGGGGPSPEELAAVEQARTLFGEEFTRLGSRAGATEKAQAAALQAASQSLLAGASESVARKAGLGQLSSLTGAEFGGGQDKLLSELLGDEQQPDVTLGEITKGAQPQTLVSNITNNFNFDINQTIDGAGEPGEVGNSIVQAFRDLFEGEIAAASKSTKIIFAR